MGQLNENKGTREDLARYRITTAKEDLKAGQILLDADEYRGANHAINAIHALDGNGYKRHKDAIANFNKQYVKTEIFPREIGRKISKAEEIRHASDYDTFYIASKDVTAQQIETAERLLKLAENYLFSDESEKE